jgi:fatty acid desaturase
MAIAEERLARSGRRGARAVKVRSREQARRRRNYATLCQVAGCLLAFWGIAILAKLIAGVNIPWLLFGVFTLLGTTLAAVMGLDDPANLPEPGVPLFRPEDDEVRRPGTVQPDMSPTYASAA